MLTEIGTIEALFRYPVKSMCGEALQEAALGLHGIEGDRRLALRRVGDHSGFPWLTSTKLADLARYAPISSDGQLPTNVRTPDGRELTTFGPELAQDIGHRYGAPVEMLHMRHGIFDDASLSVIADATIAEIARLAGVDPDVRRFRPNVAVRSTNATPFNESDWLGGVLYFGEGANAPAVSVTMHDIRCAMVNIDPDTAKITPEVLKAVVRANDTKAGIYATVVRTGRLAVGQRVFLGPSL